jgi:hypothetical protein
MFGRILRHTSTQMRGNPFPFNVEQSERFVIPEHASITLEKVMVKYMVNNRKVLYHGKRTTTHKKAKSP